MAYCLFIAKPLTEPIRIHSQWDPQERNKLQWNYNQNIKFLLNSRCQMSALLFRPWYLKFLWCWNKNILGKLGQYQGCWQVIIFEEEVFQLPVPWHRKFKYFLFFYTEDGNMYFFMFPKINSASQGLMYLPTGGTDWCLSSADLRKCQISSCQCDVGFIILDVTAVLQGSFCVCVPGQREMMLHCNVISHWLGAYTKWSLVWAQKSVWCHLRAYVTSCEAMGSFGHICITIHW